MSRLQELLAASRLALGVSVMIPSPQIVEMVGALGFDWVLIDCEHGAVGPESVELMAMAAHGAGISAIARPPSADPVDILRLLDRGVDGIQVPHVGTADEAAGVVAAARFAPLGHRSLAAGTRAGGYGLGVTQTAHAAAANQDILICVQVEDVPALAHVDAIARVPGVDVVFVGPSDLSASLGHPGQADHSEVRAAMEHAFRRVVAVGARAGTAGGVPALRRYAARGVTYFYTHLPTLLQLGSQSLWEALRADGGIPGGPR